ncbi:MAG TPA: type II/IV secretion system ATPase subunit [Candidatus Methanoculleus thermohydrogenotrophicum]|jgi:flagellar protein FlaI|nr:type II/IV secretion system ATPase subunit [Candidatus Methanoculleus thermohydrogenotrophicum]NLM81672.1 type II/IV secretion system ATPase subunit [Candidatus Methanoculleus thermohydrogenotrophicum]HOB17539.1 type II/IV secretion system ATPase subunit [Candidatus Methanoculleus thermohydrogenotrophicum]HPZ37695.1 type II/IV secretion system ATPase subunit [Candidatus Methanoculleus thermohydrogenotrophicum]HQC90798.1 type II/IV secretion system ATPase subunit [Candidatus Methanoculleus th
MGSALEATVTLPFEPEPIDEGNDCYNNVESCVLYRMLPANARDYVKESPHLLEYLHILPVNTVGIPLFLSELKRDLKSMENPNIIYPVSETTFIHIFPDPDDVRNWYIPIEPSFLHSVKAILPMVEERLIDMIDALDEDPVTEEARIEVLRNFIRQLVYIKQPGEVIDESLLAGGTPKDLKGRIIKFLTTDIGAPAKPEVEGVPVLADGRIVLSRQEYTALEYLMVRDKIEMGVLKPFLSDPYIEDITCSGVGPIFIEHKIFKGLKSVVGFRDSKELDSFVIKLAERIKRPLTYRDPIVDATLPDGSRINIVYGTEISKHGSNFTIRKVSKVPMSIMQVIESGTCDYMMAAYLWICLEFGMSVFVSGETASGKTTTLNALTTFLPPENKIITIEDTPELTVPHRNWTREVAKAKGKGEGEGSEVTMFDLLKAALRQRPNQILVGEIRGVEGSVAFSAMQTGHPVMSTFHAASVEKLIQRLCGDPINIPKTHVDNLNLVIIQSAVKLPHGGTVRRMLSINELVGYDPETEGFSFMAAFVWDPATDTFTFTGKGSSYLLESKIATMLGIPESRVAEIYDEVEKRARILEQLHKAGYTHFWDLFHMITKIKRHGLLAIEV